MRGRRKPRLYPHPPHECFDMRAANLAPDRSQKASQHSRAGERKLQMQWPSRRMIARSEGESERGRYPPLLMFTTSTCFVIDRSCSQSIIALCSAIPPW